MEHDYKKDVTMDPSGFGPCSPCETVPIVPSILSFIRLRQSSRALKRPRRGKYIKHNMYLLSLCHLESSVSYFPAIYNIQQDSF